MDIERQLSLLMQGTEYGDANLERSMRSELRALLLSGRPLRVYCGYDPTSTDLHLGHTISMRKLRQFQEFGHEVTFLIGNYTALVGDPSDKNKTRPVLTAAEIDENATTYAKQAFRILNENETRVRYNGEWLSKISLVDLIGLAQKFTVQQFLVRDNFARRMQGKEPIYLHEPLYAVMQGYDAVAMEADVQVGGTDQLFNIIVAGRKLQQSMGQKPQVGVILGILPGTDGRQKMSKSTGNHIPIASTPDDMYGKIMSIPDDAMGAYWRLVTGVSPEEVNEIESKIQTGGLHPRDAKMKLAAEITKIFWDADLVKGAIANFRTIFQDKTRPSEMPVVRVTEDETIVDILVKCGFSKSRSSARRLIQQGGVRVDGDVIVNAVAEAPSDGTLSAKEAGRDRVLQVGKRRFARLVYDKKCV